jgi:hypothetical protein
MNDNRNRTITNPPGGGGFFSGISARVQLIARLMADGRVNPLLKVIPVVSLVYLIVPDLLPGPIDDAALIWLATYLFVEMCPPDVVQEHTNAINRTMSAGGDPLQQEPEIKDEEIIDAEFREEDKP